MSGSSKQHGTNNTHSTESDWDETITLIVMAIAKGLAALAWWSVLFPMISIPVIVSLVIGFRYGPVFGFILAALAVLGLVAWSQLSPVTFHDWVTARVRRGGEPGRSTRSWIGLHPAWSHREFGRTASRARVASRHSGRHRRP